MASVSFSHVRSAFAVRCEERDETSYTKNHN